MGNVLIEKRIDESKNALLLDNNMGLEKVVDFFLFD